MPERTPSARPSATSPLRLVGYAAVLTALAFSQSTGRIIQDTKFDLVADPWHFLGRALHLWDPGQAFGQVADQAYGYFWPMGPIFGVGELIRLEPWVIQRLWWALLLNVAFFGMLLLVRELRIGRPWTQVAAAAAYVLAPRMTSLLGTNSIELWPTAVAPWVLLVIVRGCERGSVVRSAAVAALLVASCGGVNATAVSAVLPAGVIWLLTRGAGPRRWRLLAAWSGLTVLACSWWLAPLLLMGRYSPPFLDYIETAWVTQAVTGLPNTLVGTSNWVPYLSPGNYPAGVTILGTGFVLLDAAAVAALGLLGVVALPRAVRRFAVLTLMTGLLLVGFGYAGALHGWGADGRQDLLDGVLAPLRNTHKYDVLVRLALCIGIAQALALPVRAARPDLARIASRVVAATTVLVLLGLAFPWLQGKVASPNGFEQTPPYWEKAAAFLASQPDDSGTALVVPASPFGDYTWGSPHDDVIQPLARHPWAVRSVLPLAPAGNVVLLDRITEIIESGRPSAELAPLLASAGVGSLVVRNDLDRLISGAPDPAVLHAAVDGSPGLERVAGFGPTVGQQQHASGGAGRVIPGDGVSGRYPSVEVYRVDGGDASARLVPASLAVVGGPGEAGAGGAPTVLAADARPDTLRRVVLTDGMRRRQKAFQGVRGNETATMTAVERPRQAGAEWFHRITEDQERWQTVETWQGVAGVSASTAQSDADAGLPLDRGSSAAAAVDGDPATAWRSARHARPHGQWLDVRFNRPTDVERIRVTVPDGAATVRSLRISTGTSTTVVDAPRPGASGAWRIDAEDADYVRVAVDDAGAVGWWGVAELELPGVEPRRVLQLPTPPATALVDRILLRRDAERSTCPPVEDAVACQALLAASGEDGDRLDRAVVLPSSATYRLSATTSLRRDPALAASLAAAHGIRLSVSESSAVDIAQSPLAMLDGDRGTTWRGVSGEDPVIRLRLPAARVVRSIALKVGQAAPVSAPTRVRVTDGTRSVVGRLTSRGRIAIPGWTTDRLDIHILAAEAAYDSIERTVVLPTGVSELRVNARTLLKGSIATECGSGPTIGLAGRTIPTRVATTLSSALRGTEIPLLPCDAEPVDLPEGDTVITAEPSSWFRPETVRLDRAGAEPVHTGRAEVRRDERGNPVEATISRQDQDTVLTLPQNFNAGWVATLHGQELRAQRVSGWQQGWVVPEGFFGTVRFSYPPDGVYRGTLVAGAVGVLAVLLVALWPWRRREVLPPLRHADPTFLAPLGVAVVLGLLGGWAGVLLAAGAYGVVRVVSERALWAQVAAACVLLAAMPAVVPSLRDWGPTDDVAQGLALVAVALAAALSLPANGPRFLNRRIGRSRNR